MNAKSSLSSRNILLKYYFVKVKVIYIIISWVKVLKYYFLNVSKLLEKKYIYMYVSNVYVGVDQWSAWQIVWKDSWEYSWDDFIYFRDCHTSFEK